MLKKRVSNSILKEWLANPKKPKSGYKGDLRITLPAGLLRDYAEASAGDSGGPNARPVGISLPKTFIIDNFGNQKNAIKYYYGRGTSGLRDLLALSRCDFDHNKLEIRNRARQKDLKLKTKAKLSIQEPTLKTIKVIIPKSMKNKVKITFA
jgi:hypothetical protein